MALQSMPATPALHEGRHGPPQGRAGQATFPDRRVR
jgi:hypothetical protein